MAGAFASPISAPPHLADNEADDEDPSGTDLVDTHARSTLPRGSDPGPDPVSSIPPDNARPSHPDDVTVEQYAQICAELAERPTERATILDAHGFPEALWLAVDGQWRAAIAKEVEGGQNEILTRYDAAFIGAQEQFRDPIGVAEYARILIGVERGEVAVVLGQLKLRLSDLMRLQRVWTKRLAADADLASELSAALAAARAE
jgi:hypothetical protein